MWTFAFLKKRSDVEQFIATAAGQRCVDWLVVDDEHTLVLVEAVGVSDAVAAILAEHSSLVPGSHNRLVWYQPYMASEIREQYATVLKRMATEGEALAAMQTILEDALSKKAPKIQH